MVEIMIRILQCPIGNMDVGGIENMIMQIYRNIDRTKYQFDFVVHSSHNIYGEEIKKLGGKIYIIPYISNSPFKHIQQFKQLLKKHPEYRIVHIHTTYSIMYFDSYIAKKLNRILVVHSHNSNATKMHTFIHMILKKPMSKLADYRISCSQTAGKWLFSSDDDFIIWKNAIDLEKFQYKEEFRQKIRSQLGLKEDIILIGNISRLSYQKNIQLLIDIYVEYEKVNPNSNLILVGDGEERFDLEQRVDHLSCKDKIIFTGNRTNANEYLMAIDIFCLTSRWEGFGISIIEAEIAGARVIVPQKNVDEMILQLEDVHIVKDYTDKDEWINKLKALTPLNEQSRKQRYEYVCNLGFDIKSQVKMVEDFYEKIVNEQENTMNKR